MREEQPGPRLVTSLEEPPVDGRVRLAAAAPIELPSRGLALTDIETDALQDILLGDTEHRPQVDVFVVHSGERSTR